MISPRLGARMPASASSSSDWPLPATPAMPTISPACSSKLARFTRVTPKRSRTSRSLTASSTPPGRAGAFSTRSGHRPADHFLGQLRARRWSRVAVSCTTAPWRMTVTRSVTAMISRSLWVTRITVLPCSRSRASRPKSWSVSCGVSTAVGSSRIRISAPR